MSNTNIATSVVAQTEYKFNANIISISDEQRTFKTQDGGDSAPYVIAQCEVVLNGQTKTVGARVWVKSLEHGMKVGDTNRLITMNEAGYFTLSHLEYRAGLQASADLQAEFKDAGTVRVRTFTPRNAAEVAQATSQLENA